MNRTEMKEHLQSAMDNISSVLGYLIVDSVTYSKLNDASFILRGLLHLLENTEEGKGIMRIGLAEEYKEVMIAQGKEIVTTRVP